jgi:two-component system, LytTR family, sensor kinase
MKWWRRKYFNVSMHLVIWGLLISIPTLFIPWQPFLGLPHAFFLITGLFHIGVFYLNAYFLFPKLFTRKYWWLYIFSIAAVVFISFHIKLYFVSLDPQFHLTNANKGVLRFGIVPFIVASFIFRLISDRLRYERLEKEARSEKLSSELKFLRSQVSPHFLFNMLTNMVSLARHKSDLLEPSLIRLSDLLRYMLYDSQKEKISIATEVEQIRNYVQLQQLRFQDSVCVELNIRNNSNESHIEPMLLIPFIENAFKHGIGAQKDPYIIINVDAQNKHLDFSVSNNYVKGNASKDENPGIGLNNVKNRLRLLYPGRFQLSIDDENAVFFVHLTLNLS